MGNSVTKVCSLTHSCPLTLLSSNRAADLAGSTVVTKQCKTRKGMKLVILDQHLGKNLKEKKNNHKLVELVCVCVYLALVLFSLWC